MLTLIARPARQGSQLHQRNWGAELTQGWRRWRLQLARHTVRNVAPGEIESLPHHLDRRIVQRVVQHAQSLAHAFAQRRIQLKESLDECGTFVRKLVEPVVCVFNQRDCEEPCTGFKRDTHAIEIFLDPAVHFPDCAYLPANRTE